MRNNFLNINNNNDYDENNGQNNINEMVMMKKENDIEEGDGSVHPTPSNKAENGADPARPTTPTTRTKEHRK